MRLCEDAGIRPKIVSQDQQAAIVLTALAIRWIVQNSRERREKEMSERLANELLDALGSQGGAFKKKDDLYRMAQANRAFAHYRW